MFIYDKLLQEFTHVTKEGSYTSKLRKAWELLQLQAIHSVQSFGHDYLKGIVTDVQQHSVVLDLNYFKASSCTCEGGLFCSHMAALFLSYSSTLENGTSLCNEAFFQLLGVVHAKAKVSSDTKQQAKTEMKYSEIFHIFEKEYSDDWKKCKHSFHPLSQTLTNLKGFAKDKPYEEQRYYWSAAILFAISLGERAVQAVDSFSRYYYEMSFKRLIEPWVSQLNEMMNSIEVQSEWSETEIRWLEVLFGFAIDQIEKYTKSTFEWDYFVYRLVKYINFDEKFKIQVQKYAQRLLAENQPLSIQSVGHGINAMISISTHDDDQAIKSIQLAQFDKIQRIIYPAIEKRMVMQNWNAVTKWMDYLADHFEHSSNMKSIGPFLHLCQKATQSQKGERKWSSYLVRYLPHSYNILSESYLKLQDYKSWANLQIYMGRKPEDFKGIELQQIEKVSPTMLLPMYHQAIDQLVESRNRQSYRVAVKHLKKLKSMYSDLSREDSWNSYITQLQTKFARLRAFQEELSKGKVM